MPSNNIRLQKYKKNRIEGMSKYNAARAAGYSESTALARGKDLDKQAKISDVLERAGLTDKHLSKKLIELIEATDVVEVTMPDGHSEKIGNKPNWSARSKGLEMAFKLKDMLKDKELSVDNSTHLHLTTLKGDALINEARRKGITLPAEIERRLGANGFSKQADVVHP